ncbi:MAG TPA: DEAD/DEAH box helicase [Acetobacteraceae bacterium]|nr:DEAD/DEAH box helicase [Acetobacteraceae bacterium]
MPFSQSNAALRRALQARGYTEPTAVQRAVLQPEAEARDLLVSAQTGSGKTVAYGLAIAASLLGGEDVFPAATTPLALVICPTRELAQQVQRELSWLYAETGARVVPCIGGMDGRVEARMLEAGSHIVVGTPGRLCDHLQRGRLDLSALRAVVLDEADEMLDLGFREELESLLQATPEWRRTLLFSATIARDIAALARQYQQDALRIDTLVRNQPHTDIEYRAIRTAPNETEHAVVNVLRFFEAPTALVFCATREAVRHLHGSLLERGFAAVALSGELSQAERSRALQSIRDGRARICVATDVAARGLDLPDLDLVIHADLPTNPATLLHRSGRTGRAGRKGVSVLIVPANRGRRAEQLLATAGVQARWEATPDAEAIRARDAERLIEDPILAEPLAPEDVALARRLLAERGAEEIAGALIRQHRARLPAPEELSEPLGRPEYPGRREAVPGRYKADRDATRPRRDDSDTRPGRSKAGAERHAEFAVGAAGSWFSVNIGRQKKADPKWLVPLICRLGRVQKRDIGAIRIFARDTRFEISGEARADFMAALPKDDPEGIVIVPSAAPVASPGPGPGARKRAKGDRR